MTLLSPTEVKLGPGAAVFRQSRTAGTIGTLGLGGAFLAAGPIWIAVGAPWFIWVPCLVVGALVGLFCLSLLPALYRKSNWVLVINSNVLWINLRSHLNYRLAEGQTVVRVQVSEIAKAWVSYEKHSTPNSQGGSTSRSMKSLELKLSHAGTHGLVQALEQERNRETVPGKFRCSSRALHYPISVPEPGVIRIAWRGSTIEDHVTPSADHAANLLAAAGVPVQEPTFVKRGDWSQLAGAELDSRVRELALAGSRIEAIELLRERRGLGLTEAKRVVDSLTDRT